MGKLKVYFKNGFIAFIILASFTNINSQEKKQKEPMILNAGFDIEGNESYRDYWKNRNLGGIVQITKKPVHSGVRSAKFPADGSRIAYQLIKVKKNKNYKISFYYTMKSTPVGALSVAVLAGHVTDLFDVTNKTIESVTLKDQISANKYVLASVSFNSGNNSKIAIFISNVGVESRIDSFKIIEN